MATLIPFAKSFYSKSTQELAQSLLGHTIMSTTGGQITSGIIIETEAYLHNDPASHSFKGKTTRNSAMFGPAGSAYLYQIYGIHTCLNVVSSSIGVGEAVLIRSLYPTAGIAYMQQRRKISSLDKLCSGPGNICQALNLNITLNGHDLSKVPLSLIQTPQAELEAFWRICYPEVGCRIGITKGKDLPLRFRALASCA